MVCSFVAFLSSFSFLSFPFLSSLFYSLFSFSFLFFSFLSLLFIFFSFPFLFLFFSFLSSLLSLEEFWQTLCFHLLSIHSTFKKFHIFKLHCLCQSRENFFKNERWLYDWTVIWSFFVYIFFVFFLLFHLIETPIIVIATVVSPS